MESIRKKLAIVILIMLIVGVLPSSLIVGESKVFATGYSNWESVGDEGFSSGPSQEISLDVHNGTPYVAYRDSTYGNRLVVKQYNGTSWEDLGSPGFSDGSANHISIHVYNDIPYVAYQDANSRATVKKYNGVAWEDVGEPRFSAGNATAVSLFVYEGTPYVAYRDVGNSWRATVMMFNGSSWEIVGTAGFSAGRANNTSLFVYEGTPYVAYLDEANARKATVKKYNGTEWEGVGQAGFSAGEAYETQMIVYNDTPYVLYSDHANGEKATVMKYDRGNWEEVGETGFSQGAAENLSLDVYEGTLYVGYTDGSQSRKATVKRFNGSEWEDVGQAGFSAGQTHNNSLSIDEGNLYVAYRDMWNDYKATVMKYRLPTYTIASLSDQKLADLTEGYDSETQETRTITIARTGTGDLKNISVKLLEENSDFMIAQPTVTTINDEVPETTFTIKAKNGLTAGTYTETVQVEADYMKAVTFDVTQEVLLQTAQPVANPSGGEYAAGTSVELTTETSGATIYYSTDDSEPTRSSAEYTEPIEITEAMTIKAIAVKDGMTDSEVLEEHYTVLPPEQVVAPVANPSGGEYAAGTSIELTTETPDATILYTTDDSEPTRSSTEYTARIEITAAVTIKAIAVKDGMTDSEMLEEHYTVYGSASRASGRASCQSSGRGVCGWHFG
ncbi:chitobiase/beta-hexosaminidase C-terminal domain-containing protein [Bacillus horti]|uniref:LysM repeat protein n=1 Tax=Caldalkalibacillus horti TaxID=77523 RepID=A0ABT9W6C0_9BACI|nr:chitobiase/beta-hexosaminidase C-terminal domain-containing protein [Bacillus horti]MDQ0168390.1 LysM repeat protein [Bacillus horti]